jgi:hypothetical protein
VSFDGFSYGAERMVVLTVPFYTIVGIGLGDLSRIDTESPPKARANCIMHEKQEDQGVKSAVSFQSGASGKDLLAERHYALCARPQVLNEKGLLPFSLDGRRRSRTLCFLYTCASAFLERDVAVQAQIGETFDQFAGARPSHFHPIDFRTLADTEDHTRVVRR